MGFGVVSSNAAIAVEGQTRPPEARYESTFWAGSPISMARIRPPPNR